jgi:hypothetical protein
MKNLVFNIVLTSETFQKSVGYPDDTTLEHAIEVARPSIEIMIVDLIRQGAEFLSYNVEGTDEVHTELSFLVDKHGKIKPKRN